MAIALGFVDLRTRAHAAVAVEQYIPQVLNGTAEAPGLYRVFAPMLFDAFRRVSGLGAMNAWHAFRLVWFLAALFSTHLYLRTWCATPAAMLGTCLTAALLPLTFTNSWGHPDHLPELTLFTLACTAIARSADFAFAVLLIVAAFNRETAAFLVPVYLLGGTLTRDRILKTGAFAMLWLGVFAGLRWARGLQTYDWWQLGRNLEFLGLLPAPYDPYYRAYAWFVVVLLGPLLWIAWVTRAEPAPLFVRRALWVVPMVLGVAFALSSIIETRIFTPTIPLILPGVMVGVAGAEKRIERPSRQ
jgi:hypothetical protein